MLTVRLRWVLAVILLLGTPAAYAQFDGNMFDRPEIRDFWNPVVGIGAIYETSGKDSPGRTRTQEYQLLGEETVDGKTAYWLEISLDSPTDGMFYGKNLIVPGESRPHRTIIQYPGLDPMEMQLHPNPAAKHDIVPTHVPHKIGMETITVPAGTFVCDHWKDDTGKEAWTNSRVGPITIVKSVSPGETMILVKTITNAKDHITGTVKPYDPRAIVQLMQQQRAKQ